MKLLRSFLVACAIVFLSYSTLLAQINTERSNRLIRPLPANTKTLRAGAPNETVAGDLIPGTGQMPRASEASQQDVLFAPKEWSPRGGRPHLLWTSEPPQDVQSSRRAWQLDVRQQQEMPRGPGAYWSAEGSRATGPP